MPSRATPQTQAAYLTKGYWAAQGTPAHKHASGDITVDLTGLTAEGQALARTALDAWAGVADLRFREVASGGRIVFDDAEGGAFASTSMRGGIIQASEVNVGTDWIGRYGSTIGTYGFQTYLHEIGHALGLGHAGPYNGSASFARDARHSTDSWQWSIMSYFSQNQNTLDDGSSYALAVTPMMADILAVQALYGAPRAGAPGSGAGDTTYGAGASTGTYLDAFFAAGRLASHALTLHDAGGVDTLDLSDDGRAQRVDLAPGSFSSVHGLHNNLAISTGTLIENVATGGGADGVTGNAAANVLRLGAGNDVASGGGGHDRLLGEDGADALWGEDGNDALDGGAGADVLRGGSGLDALQGGAGDDILHGDSGADMLDGGADADQMWGGSGADALWGGDGDDVLVGGTGDDVLRGEGGADGLWGGRGRDRLEGGEGADALSGGRDADVLDGGAGDDQLWGGAGNDSFVFTAGGGADRVMDFRNNKDTIVLDDALWGGERLSVAQVLAMAQVDGGDVLFSFADGSTLRVENLGSVGALSNDLAFC